MTRQCEVLIPTRDRPAALAVTLAGLAGQASAISRIVIADQSHDPSVTHGEVAAMIRVLEVSGVEVAHHMRPLLRGIAEQRAFLLGQARAVDVLFLDDDVWLYPWAVVTMLKARADLCCGFVGMAVQGLSYMHDRRPSEMAVYEAWDGPVVPEVVRPGEPAWDRHRLHNAANATHLAQELGATPQRWIPYRIAWVGGCVLFDRSALEEVGGFTFWKELPVPHAGEDVLVQLRVMARFGAAGILPSGAVHLEVPTTIPERPNEAYRLVSHG